MYHLEKGWNAPTSSSSISILESGPLRCVILARHELSKTSTLEQKIIITAADAMIDFETRVDWTENRVMLVSDKWKKKIENEVVTLMCCI